MFNEWITQSFVLVFLHYQNDRNWRKTFVSFNEFQCTYIYMLIFRAFNYCTYNTIMMYIFTFILKHPIVFKMINLSAVEYDWYRRLLWRRAHMMKYVTRCVHANKSGSWTAERLVSHIRWRGPNLYIMF